MHNGDVARGASLGQSARSFGIGAERRLDVVFGAIDRGVGRGVDHDIGTDAVQQRRDRVQFCQVDPFAGRSVCS